MTETTDRPLVTFAVFAYNQEEYIREAIEGAFSQTYEPLEIILSDDCSTDQTFAIMTEMAQAYEGRHSIRVRRSEVNLGTALHVYAVAMQSSGNLIVVAAGDDVSVQHRATTLVDAWCKANKPAATIHSTMTSFDNQSNQVFIRNRRSPDSGRINISWYVENSRLPFYAQTCAYTKSLFTDFPPIIGGSLIEDGVLATRCFLTGRFVYVDEPLVQQRISDNNAGSGLSFRDPSRWNRIIRSRIIDSCNALQDIRSIDGDFEYFRNFEDVYYKRLRNLGHFFVPESRAMTFAEKCRLFYHFCVRFPTRAGLSRRIIRAAAFFELQNLPMLQTFKKVMKKSRTR